MNYVYTATSANGQTGPTTAQRDAERARFDVAEAQNREAVRTAAEQLATALLGANANNYRVEWSDTEYVRRLYETFLRHAPDTAGWEYWAGEAGKQGRGPVLGAFLEAGAYREQADALYREIYWLVGDQLGTPRLIVSRTGSLASVKRHDYLPFGEELPIGAGGRATSQGYVGDSVRQQFTGYERDDETGLDYAQARYYGSNMGRFVSVDPVAGSCWNPQTLNAYSYAWNNPLKLTDPTGMTVSWEDSKKEKKKDETEAKTAAQRKYEKHLNDMVNSENKKTREKGLKLKAAYERLQNSDITFHVVKEDANKSEGELTYKGQEGHLYANLKGNPNERGALNDIQKIAHEFRHGEQFLDGQIGFTKNAKTGKWDGYRDDLVDEAEAFITGFEAQSLDPAQRSDEFLNAIETARPFGVDAVVKVLDSHSQSKYKGRSPTQLPITNLTPTIYAIPRNKN